MSYQKSFKIPVAVPGAAREAADAYQSVVSRNAPLARKVDIVHDDNLGGVTLPAGLTGWTSTYDAAAKRLSMVSSYGDATSTTDEALNAVGVVAGAARDGSLRTSITWDALVSWTIRDVYTIAGGPWPQYYADNIEGQSGWTVVMVSMSPDNASFAFVVAVAAELGGVDHHIWIGERQETDVIAFKYVGVENGSTFQMALVAVDAGTCLFTREQGGSVNVLRFTEGADGAFAREVIHSGTWFFTKDTAAHSATDVAIAGSDKKLYLYDGSSTLTAVDVTGASSLDLLVCVGANAYLSAGMDNIHLVENGALTRVINHAGGFTTPTSIYADPANTTAYLVFDRAVYTIDYSGNNARQAAATVVQVAGELEHVRYVAPVTGFEEGVLVLSTTDDTYARFDVRRGEMAGADITVGATDAPEQERILNTNLGVVPVFHSNNGTGLVFGSNDLVGVYGTGTNSSFETTVLRAADEAQAEVTTVTPTPAPSPADASSGGLGAEWIALIVVAGVLLLVVIAYLWWRHRRRNRAAA